jgi:hypothetical protein
MSSSGLGGVEAQPKEEKLREIVYGYLEVFCNPRRKLCTS